VSRRLLEHACAFFCTSIWHEGSSAQSTAIGFFQVCVGLTPTKSLAQAVLGIRVDNAMSRGSDPGACVRERAAQTRRTHSSAAPLDQRQHEAHFCCDSSTGPRPRCRIEAKTAWVCKRDHRARPGPFNCVSMRRASSAQAAMGLDSAAG